LAARVSALGRYYVLRDMALEAGDEAGVLAADLGLEMVHRPPEEWEWPRVQWREIWSWMEWPGEPAGPLLVSPLAFEALSDAFEPRSVVIESVTLDPDIWTGRLAGDKRRTREFQQAMAKRLRRR